jgi:hypothetical protein
MCFGPVSSFTASGILLSLWTVVLKNVRNRKELLFASFPILFAIQQCIEGALWLALRHKKPQALVHELAFSFLIFAYVLWPTLCPASVYAIEYDQRQREKLRFVILLGLSVSSYLLFFLIKNPVDVYIVNGCIRYNTYVPAALWFTGIYVTAVVAPYFLSTQRAILFFGIPNLVFFVVARLFYSKAFVSVWCFFAAILSLTLYFFLKNIHHERMLPLLAKARPH